MASTYSSLKIQLMATGENSGTWGTVTNTNLGTAIEEAIVGSADVSFSNADVTLTLTDTNATQSARNLRLNLTGTITTAQSLIVPAIEKVYIINNGLSQTVTVKNSTGTGIAVPAGKTMYVYNNGTNVLDAITHLTSLTLATALPIASGGTGSTTATFSGANITSLNASNVSSGTLANARTTAASANGASTIVARGTSGEFSAGTITATFSGDGSAVTSINASNISSGTLANARTTASSSNGASTIVARDASGDFTGRNVSATNFIGTLNGSGANVTSINASNISSGTLANARTTASDANGASTIVARDASGNFSANVITANGSSITAINASNISSGTLANARTTASDANGASTIVARDASGNFSANVITANGSSITAINASNISSGTLANARTTASSSNGASTIVARGASGEFAAGTITATFSGDGSAVTAINGSNISSGTVANARTTASSSNGASTIVARDASGNFSANVITANGSSITSLNADSISSGTLAVARGGTGAATLTAENVIIGNGTSAVKFVAPGTSGNVLTSNGSAWASTAPASGGFSGATINAVGSSAITLTNTSTQYQQVQINSLANSSVTLPNAATMSTEGSYPFVIDNRSPLNQPITIKNNGGTIISAVSPAEIATCSLIDNSTANGTWTIDNQSLDNFFVGDSSSLTSTALTGSTSDVSSPSGSRLIALTSTKFIIYYCTQPATSPAGTYTIRIRVGDISGSTITYGSEQTTTFNPGTGGGSFANAEGVFLYAMRLSDSAFVLYNASGNRWQGCNNEFYANAAVRTCTVSGTTVTFGSASALSFPSISANTNPGSSILHILYNFTLARMSDTKFAVFYNTGITSGNSYPTGYSGSLGCNIITVSGTTQTIGTKVDLGTSTFTQPLAAVCYDTDKLLVVYGQGTSGSTLGRSKVVVVTVSTTTPTWNTPVNIQAADSVCQISGTSTNPGSGWGYAITTSKCFVPYMDTAARGAIVDISVTTPSVSLSGPLTNDVIKPPNGPYIINSTTLGINNVNYNSYFRVSTDGFYRLGSPTAIYSAESARVASLPATGGTSLITTSGAGSGALSSVLATAVPTS